MGWKNYGSVWEIDHIIPFASIDVENLEELAGVIHYTNIQPLLVSDNRSKGAKIDWTPNN